MKVKSKIDWIQVGWICFFASNENKKHNEQMKKSKTKIVWIDFGSQTRNDKKNRSANQFCMINLIKLKKEKNVYRNNSHRQQIYKSQVELAHITGANSKAFLAQTHTHTLKMCILKRWNGFFSHETTIQWTRNEITNVWHDFDDNYLYSLHVNVIH